MTRDPADRAEKIAGLAQRYRRGEISETVFTASLIAAGMRKSFIDDLVAKHQGAFQESVPYKRGDYR